MALLRFVALLVVFVVAAALGSGSTSIVRGVTMATALHGATPDATTIDDDDDDDVADIHEFGTPAPGSDRDDEDDGDADADATLTDGVAASQRIALSGAVRSFVSRVGIRPSGGHCPPSDRPPQT